MTLYFRKSFMSDLPERKNELNREDTESKMLIRQSIGSINKERRDKQEC